MREDRKKTNERGKPREGVWLWLLLCEVVVFWVLMVYERRGKTKRGWVVGVVVVV